jgi:hypothetical protein
MPRPIGLDLKPLAATHELGATATPAIRDFWRSNILLDAHLRAYERSLGAERAGDEEMAAARLTEARH